MGSIVAVDNFLLQATTRLDLIYRTKRHEHDNSLSNNSMKTDQRVEFRTQRAIKMRRELEWIGGGGRSPLRVVGPW